MCGGLGVVLGPRQTAVLPQRCRNGAGMARGRGAASDAVPGGRGSAGRSSRGEVAALRRATRTECPLGEPGFVEELEAKFQVRLRPLPPGPPAKKPAQARDLPVEIVRQAGA